MRLVRPVAALLVAACSGSGHRATPMSHAYADGDARVCFPAPATARRAHEGPFAKALIVHTELDGARYELARFDLPKPLSREQRAVLMKRVEKGLSARPDATHIELGTVVADGHVARALAMRARGDRFGKWLLSFPTASQMLQVSVVGPRRAQADAERFLATLGRTDCAPR